ncbi:MAG TPA: 30S ribosomal protein S2 [Phycisphaerae bacterium]|nr:30S ribosomal protein S2 [Phycisphaerae bacterium]
MSQALVRELIDAGIHFGHRASRWNPKMGAYIFGKRNSIHIIDIRQTVKGLLRAKKFLSTVVANGQDVLIIGTKRQAKDSVEKHARRVGMPFVAERWLGGTLTNFKTIRSRLTRLEYLEEVVRSGKIEEFSKKEKARASREREKIFRNLEGIRTLTRLPGAIVVVDIKREHIAIKEAQKLRIPTVCLVDTDSNPDGADIIIPGNDDAMRGIELVIAALADAVEEGKRGREAMAQKDGEQSAGGPGHGRRSRRASTSTLAADASEPMPGEFPDKDVEAAVGATSEASELQQPQTSESVS